MVVQTIQRTDPNLHQCGPTCVPCGRRGCTHCHYMHRSTTDECNHPHCTCSEFAVGEPCPDCNGQPTERFVVGLGMTEVRCPNLDCVDGLI